MNVTISLSADALRNMEKTGGEDAFVMGAELLDEEFEVAVRVMPRRSHTEPLQAARRPSAEEVAVVLWFLCQEMRRKETGRKAPAHASSNIQHPTSNIARS